MKNIGIVEIGYHPYPLSELCKISNIGSTNVTVFTTKELFRILNQRYNLTKEKYDFILKEKDEGNIKFLKRVERICNEKIDVLIIETVKVPVTENYPFLFFNPQCKTLVTVHNANSWFDLRNFQLSTGRKGIKGKIFTANYDLGIMIKKILLPRYEGILTLYPPQKDYIRRTTNYGKEIFTLMYAVFKDVPPFQNEDNTIHFVVPGNICKRKKGTQRILRVFEELFAKYNKEIELLLLGINEEEKYGHSIMKECKLMRKKGYSIRYVVRHLSRPAYYKKYIKNDIVLFPFKIGPEKELYGDVYGTTKASATLFDCIRFAKPFVTSQSFKVIEELETSSLTYKNEKELKVILESLINNREKLQELKVQALKNAKKFSLKKQKARFKKIIEDFL